MKSTHIRRLVIVLYLLAATLLLAHSINAFVEHELTAMPGSGSDKTVTTEPGSPRTESSIQLVEQIRASSLFPLPTQPSVLSANGAPAALPKPPLDIAKKLRLLGTIVSDREGGAAVIEDIASKRQGLFHLHDTIPDLGEIHAIRRDGVVIRLDDQEELLEPAVLQQDQARPVPVAMTSSQQAFVPLLKRTLDRREVLEAVSDPTKLMMQAHAVPHITNGTLNGFRLDFVAPASFFEKAGFLYGDVIQRINGVEIRDPGWLLSSFQQVVNERTVKVDLIRSAQNATLTYDLR
ncbi:MAG: type II secretion system protein N [Nitrospirota bacterium]|nr:type II secretion system protein N [Nitrospirota bacterium]